MNPSFASGHVKNLSTLIVEECMTFRETLRRLAKEGKPFDMEVKGAELVFDVIARIIYAFPLEAQRKGSQTLSDLREVVHLVEAGLSMNPLDKIKAWLKKDKLTKRLDAAVRTVIHERFDALKHDKIVPSRKNPYSTLDLMLREQLMLGDGVKDIDPEFEKLLITKWVRNCHHESGNADILKQRQRPTSWWTWHYK